MNSKQLKFKPRIDGCIKCIINLMTEGWSFDDAYELVMFNYPDPIVSIYVKKHFRPDVTLDI